MTYEITLQIDKASDMDTMALILLHNGYEVYYAEETGNLCIGSLYPEYVIGK